MNRTDTIARAHKIATELEAEGYSPEDGSMVLSMALGIFVEGTENSHRNLEPLIAGMHRAAQIAFDALRQSRQSKPGTA
jgi:hypothetical protein